MCRWLVCRCLCVSIFRCAWMSGFCCELHHKMYPPSASSPQSSFVRSLSLLSVYVPCARLERCECLWRTLHTVFHFSLFIRAAHTISFVGLYVNFGRCWYFISCAIQLLPRYRISFSIIVMRWKYSNRTHYMLATRHTKSQSLCEWMIFYRIW